MDKLNLFNSDKLQIINILYYFFPIAVALGNAAINTNILFIIFCSLAIDKKKLFFIEKNFYNLFFFSFFLLIIIFSFLNYFDFNSKEFFTEESKKNFYKSIFFLRFLLLYIILSNLILLKKFNIKYFFLIGSIVSLFLGLDIVYESIFHEDIFGYKTDPNSHRISGFFGSEYIAGGFLQKYSFYLIFFFPYLCLKNFKSQINYILFFSIFFFVTILLTNNRMPLILYTLGLALFFFFFKKYRLSLIKLSVLLSAIFLIFFFNNSRLNNFFLNYFKQANQIILVLIKSETVESNKIIIQSDYAKLFNSSKDLIIQNKIYGYGIKSFRENCFKNLEKKLPNRSCNNHPHNYYFEIIISMGFLGFLIFSIIMFLTIKNFLIYYISNIKSLFDKKIIILIPFIIFLIELFPIRSSGAFFTSGNFYFFILLAIINNLKLDNVKF